jgi:hypothetical protein
MLKLGGDPNLMLSFNEAISKLGIIELPNQASSSPRQIANKTHL